MSEREGRNVAIGGVNESGRVASALTGRAADLARIASFVYLADQAVSRGGPYNAHHSKWRRTMALCIPVGDPDFWEQVQVATRLERALEFATDDEWLLSFTRAPGPTQQRLPLADAAEHQAQLKHPPDHVLLLSGGTDSLCAAVQVIRDGGRPYLVSHRPSPAHDARQQKLGVMLSHRFDLWPLGRLGFSIHRIKWEAKESSQRSRAFLFASLGAGVAHEIGVPKVVLADNGMVSIGLPFHGGLPGALISRTTHPRFHELFNELLEIVLPGITVTNPLLTATRSESLRVLMVAGCPELLADTNSCGRARNTGGAATHCGYCSQCVDRRIGMIHAGLEQYEPPNPYALDIFRQRLDPGEKRTVPLSYVLRAQRIIGLGEHELFEKYPQLFNCLPDDPALSDRAASDLQGMVKRHAEEVRQVMLKMLERYGDRQYRGEAVIEVDSLLRLVFDMNTPVAEVEEARPTDGGEINSGAILGPTFRRQGAGWTLTYNGKTAQLPNLDGLLYIAHLLDNPGQEISVLSLQAMLSSSSANIGVQIAVSPESEARESGLSSHRLTNPKVDQTYREQLKQRLIDNQQERVEAIRHRDEVTQQRLDREAEDITERLTKDMGLQGKSREFPDDVAKASAAVRAAIRRARSRIGAYLPELEQHLVKSLQTRTVCRYSPVPSVKWVVDL